MGCRCSLASLQHGSFSRGLRECTNLRGLVTSNMTWNEELRGTRAGDIETVFLSSKWCILSAGVSGFGIHTLYKIFKQRLTTLLFSVLLYDYAIPVTHASTNVVYRQFWSNTCTGRGAGLGTFVPYMEARRRKRNISRNWRLVISSVLGKITKTWKNDH